MGKSYRNNDEYSKKWASNRKNNKSKNNVKKKNIKNKDYYNDVD